MMKMPAPSDNAVSGRPESEPTGGNATLPEPYLPALEPYLVYSRIEMLAILRGLSDAHVLATVYFGGTRDFLISRVLDVNSESGSVVFDVAPDERVTRQVLASAELTFVSFFNHVKVQFSVDRAELVQFEGGPALQVRMPRCVLRLQRRMAYRVKTPVANSPNVQLTTEVRPVAPPVSYRIADISATGFAFVFQAGQTQLEQGATIGPCRFELTSADAFDADIEVRRVTAFKDGFGRDMRRVGCRFLHIPGTAEMAIQCYVNRLTVSARKAGGDPR